jgi:hypothetical protein
MVARGGRELHHYQNARYSYCQGESLAATVSYFEEHLGRHRCFVPENQGEYERRECIASEYFRKLKDSL